MAQNTFLVHMQTDIIHIITHAAIREFFKTVDVFRHNAEKI